MQKDYAEILLEAVDQVVSERLKGISYDVTDTVEITNADDASSGKYKVSDGAATYYAYSSDTTYEVGDVVYMTVPNGDYTKQKIIIGKYVAENDKPYVFQTPFQTIVDITGNIITDKVIPTTGLIANNPADVKMTLLWEKDFKETNQPLNGYTRLGLQAQFRSWLADLECAKGDYGLLIRVTIQNDITNDYAERMKKCYDIFQEATEALTETSDKITYIQQTLKITLPDNIFSLSLEEQKQAISDLHYNTFYKTYDLQLSTNDMYGDPFNYTSFYQQEQVFDITNLGTIYKCALYFYEKPSTFISKTNEVLPYQDDFGNLLIPNLFVKDPYICLGYSVAEFEDESAVLFTNSTRTFTSKQSDVLNSKTVQLRWFHEGKGYNIVPDNLTDYEIRWYRYAFGSPAADEYCGVYWKRVNEDGDDFLYSFIPNTNKENEQVKVIIIQGTNYITSNILTFTNEQEVVNDATKDFLSGLNIWCADGTYGNYYIYDPGNKILEQFRTAEAHKLVAMFSAEDGLLERSNAASVLTEAESITWTFNTTATMITVNNINYSYKYNDTLIVAPTNMSSMSVDSTGKIYTYICDDNSIVVYDSEEKIVSITRKGDINNGYTINAEQYYFVKENYAQSAQNNIVQCKIVKDGKEYYTSKRFGFGQAGTTGTDATLRIYFDPAYRHSLISKPGGDTLNVRAVLYDSQNQEIDLNDETDYSAKVIWSWEVSSGTAVSITPLLATEITGDGDYNLQIGEKKYNSNSRNEVVLQSSSQIDINTFLILKVTIKNWGDYDLTVCRPVPVSAQSFVFGSNGTKKPIYVDCAEEVIYSTTGYPDYYKEPWRLHCADDYDSNTSTDIVPGTWSIYKGDAFKGEFSDKNILNPLGFYVKSAEHYGAQFKYNNTILWTQPIYICQNNYPSATLNRWDGKTLTTDANTGTILSTAIAAGKKIGNTFSGVILGDWKSNESASADDISKMTGIYGFNEGAVSYAFTEDGTGFIGKSGSGRILFDGNKSTITSNLYANGGKTAGAKGGMCLDFDDGLIKLVSPENIVNQITINVSDKEFPFRIGQESKFKVAWDGTMHATNGNFSGTITGTNIKGSTIEASSAIYIPSKNNAVFSVDSSGNLTAKNADITGKITATSGEIGGFKITKTSLYSTNNTDGTYGNASGIYLGCSGQFSLGDKFKFSGSTLFIATNIYRPSANGEDNNYFLIGVNKLSTQKTSRLQIGSADEEKITDYSGISMYGHGGDIFFVPSGSSYDDSVIVLSGSGKYTETDGFCGLGSITFRVKAENQKGIYARFA